MWLFFFFFVSSLHIGCGYKFYGANEVLQHQHTQKLTSSPKHTVENLCD